MSQRRALIASIIITLVLALSAIGIRAAMTDTPAVEDAAAKSSLPLLVTGNDTTQGDDGTSYDDDSNEHEGENEDQSYASSGDDTSTSSSTKGEAWHEEENDDD